MEMAAKTDIDSGLREHSMALEFCVLASGSAGNATVLRAGGQCALIDAGIGPRAADKRMIGTGITPADIRAICLTHLDTDHFSPAWLAGICRQEIKVYCAEGHAKALRRLARQEKLLKPLQPLLKLFGTEPFDVLPDVRCRTLRLPHDKQGSQGFLFEYRGSRLGFATDLGRAPVELIELFAGVDLLAMESNYDSDMQLSSRRSDRVKKRIMGGRGHLSNVEAFEAVQDILDLTEARHGAAKWPRHLVLLHRSRQCNSPSIVLKLFNQDPRIAPILTLAHQNQRTEWLSSAPRQALPGEQLGLFDMAAAIG